MDKLLKSLSDSGIISNAEIQQFPFHQENKQRNFPQILSIHTQNNEKDHNKKIVYNPPNPIIFNKKLNNPFINFKFNTFWPNQNQQLWNQSIRNQKVFLIGPADYTLKINRKKLLSQFDLIARCNHSIPVNPQHEDSIGKVTDIYYNNLYVQGFKNQLSPHLLHSCKVKSVNCPYPYIPPFKQNIDRYFIKKEGGNLPFRVMSLPLYKLIENSIKTRPNTGILALMDLTCSDINMLYLTGFTFFTTSTVYSNSIGIDQTLHNQSSQILFVKNQSFSNQKLLLDKTIRQILWKNEYQWIEYQWNLIKQHLVINSINDKWSGIHEKISLKHTLWTWNIYQVATLYVYDELQWKNVLTIDCKELELPEQNIFGNVIHQKNKNPLPVWLKSWWFIQQSWMNHVIIPNEDKNHDSFIPTIWLWTHTTKSTENPFSDSYYLPMSDIMMGNISFNNVLIGTNQCRWIESMEDFIKLVDWKLFFE